MYQKSRKSTHSRLSDDADFFLCRDTSKKYVTSLSDCGITPNQPNSKKSGQIRILVQESMIWEGSMHQILVFSAWR